MHFDNFQFQSHTHYRATGYTVLRVCHAGDVEVLLDNHPRSVRARLEDSAFAGDDGPLHVLGNHLDLFRKWQIGGPTTQISPGLRSRADFGDCLKVCLEVLLDFLRENKVTLAVLLSRNSEKFDSFGWQ